MANIPLVSLTPMAICHRFNDTRGTGGIDGGVIDTGCKFANGVIDTGGAPPTCEYLREFSKNSKLPLCYFHGLGEGESGKKIKQKSCETVPLMCLNGKGKIRELYI